MISYALITKDKLTASWDSLKSIQRLPKHEHEIIVYCPWSSNSTSCDGEAIDEFNLRMVYEDEPKGSPHAFNEVIKHAKGKYVSYLLNNIIYPTNLLDVVDYLENGDFKNKKVKLVNLMWQGGPGVVNNYHHDTSVNGVMWEPHLGTPVNIWHTPYPVIPLPFVALDTIDKYLDGHIFNPAFRNHYPDHWLGFYISRIEEYKPYEWNCPTIQYGQSHHQRISNTSSDYEDGEVLRHLTEKYGADNNVKYTVKL